MTIKTQTIEVDDATAATLRAQAAAQGLSVADLIAGLTALARTPVALSSAETDDLDRRWAAVQAGEATVPHDDVVRWLGEWGTADFKPWRER